MRKLVLQVFDYSLDGIIGVEDTAFFEFCRELPDDPDLEAWRRGALERAGLHIMGRKTYEGMAGYFPTADAGHPYAEIMNTAPKAVFSSTLKSAGWNNSTIVNGDTATEIEKLKQDGTGDIMAHGGVSFVQSLVRLDMVDEYLLTVFPYLAGPGASLFAELPGPQPLELVSGTAFGNGTVGLAYRRPPRP
ncbi:MAG TPA: dihydrofolate reductase family protein [Streptosporangiaceae bacterium]|nr:dihydrofolate reductase family protein [Streptosporangiaceae bacterium]